MIHRRQGDKVHKNTVILPDNGNVGLHVCAKFHDHTYTIMLRCHDNGNVGLHVCAEFHDHTYAVLYAHSKV